MFFFANDCDPCIMTRCSEGVRATVVIYTDDHLISNRKLLHMESVISTSDKKCNKLKVSTGKIHSYIGMVFDFTHSENVSVN